MYYMNKALQHLLVLTLFLSSISVVIAQDDAMPPAPLGAWQDCATPSNLPDVIQIGAPLGLTGPISVYGVPQQLGIDLAIQEINGSGYLGDATLEMIYEDTEGDAEQAIAAMTKLIDEDNVTVVFGPSLSTESFAAAPIAQENGVPVMGVTTSAIGIPQQGDFVFRGNLPEAVLIPVMVGQVQDLFGIERVAVLYGDDDDFTISGYDVFVQTLEDLDITITDEATFARGDVDFSPQLTNLIADEPDAIVASALGAEGINIIVQARQLGFDGLILGGNGFNTPDVIAQAGEDAENLIVGASWNIASDNELSTRFVAMFEEAYDFTPDQFSVQAYTVIWLYATAMRCGNSVDGADIRDQLLMIENFESPLGAFSFDPEGEPIHPPVTQIVRDGAFVLLTPELLAD
jgi:branched-chain amino acid transport system substrate-binding protein